MANTEGPEGTGEQLAAGTVIGGKYRIDRMLAEGAMGQVYVAIQEPIGRKVAVKLLKRALVGDAELKERFLREAVAVSKLHHPNTITVLDYGEYAGTLFMTMELLDGEDLDALLTREGPLTVERAAHLAGQIASALTEAHDKNVLHRDLKPPNIFVSRVKGKGEFVKVLDFGIAKLLDNAEAPLTRAGMVFGTPEYMAPEQSTGGDLDGRTDLYALGIILWQMLIGDLPYTGSHPLDTALKHTTEPIPAPPETLPEPMRAFLVRTMAKNKEGRPDDAEAFVMELRTAAGITTPLPPEPPPLTGSLKAVSPMSSSKKSSLPKILAMLAVLALFGFLVAGAVGVHFLYEQDSDIKAASIRTVLEVDCKQSKAKVRRDGKSLGNTPVDIKGEPGDEVNISVEKKGFKTEKRTFRFPQKGRDKVTIDLERKKDKNDGGDKKDDKKNDKKDGWKPGGVYEY
jgi:serine/threonine protein kinase